jgi:hypothetical protein
MNDINEQYLNRLYEDLAKEQMKLMGDMKTGCDTDKEKQIHKQLTFINTLMINTLRLRNLKKTILEKINC